MNEVEDFLSSMAGFYEKLRVKTKELPVQSIAEMSKIREEQEFFGNLTNHFLAYYAGLEQIFDDVIISVVTNVLIKKPENFRVYFGDMPPEDIERVRNMHRRSLYRNFIINIHGIVETSVKRTLQKDTSVKGPKEKFLEDSMFSEIRGKLNEEDKNLIAKILPSYPSLLDFLDDSALLKKKDQRKFFHFLNTLRNTIHKNFFYTGSEDMSYTYGGRSLLLRSNQEVQMNLEGIVLLMEATLSFLTDLETGYVSPSQK